MFGCIGLDDLTFILFLENRFDGTACSTQMCACRTSRE